MGNGKVASISRAGSATVQRPSNTLTLHGGGGTLDVATAATNVTVTSNIGGTGGLTKAGAGTLELTGATMTVGRQMILREDDRGRTDDRKNHIADLSCLVGDVADRSRHGSGHPASRRELDTVPPAGQSPHGINYRQCRERGLPRNRRRPPEATERQFEQGATALCAELT